MKKDKIRVALAGVGNCASSLVQGVFYYRNATAKDSIPGLITTDFGGYLPGDLEFSAAFDIDRRKVGEDLSEAIFAPPNCTTVFCRDIPHLNCPVSQGYTLDGVASHMQNYPVEHRFDPLEDVYKSVEEARETCVRILRRSGTQVLVNYMPVGAEDATRFYAECALEAGCAFVNAIPVFISRYWGKRFEQAGLPILGDDIKSQVGATIVHRVLTSLFRDRGEKIQRTYQLNIGGNTDFLNMVDRSRLKSKKESKTGAVTALMDGQISPENIYVGPSDYVPWLKDRKICFIRIEAKQFGDVPMDLELRLSVEDSPNSAGVILDAIRAARVALDRRLAGPIVEASAYLFKSPVRQFDDNTARDMLRAFAGLPPVAAARDGNGEALSRPAAPLRASPEKARS